MIMYVFFFSDPEGEWVVVVLIKLVVVVVVVVKLTEKHNSNGST
jgi:hypothetical protein